MNIIKLKNGNFIYKADSELRECIDKNDFSEKKDVLQKNGMYKEIRGKKIKLTDIVAMKRLDYNRLLKEEAKFIWDFCNKENKDD